MNISQILFDQVERTPDALAIRHASGDLTYRAFGSRVAGIAAGLLESGVRPQEVVAVRLDDPLDHWTATLALAHMGATVVSIPRSMPDVQRERLMTLTQCSRVMTGDEYPLMQFALSPPVVRLSDIQAFRGDGLYQPAVIRTNQPWLYINGSGSTGRPKVLPVTHEQELMRTNSQRLQLPYGPEDTVLSLVSMHFSHAKRRSLEALLVGAASYLSEPGRVDYRTEVYTREITVIEGMVYHINKLLSMLSSDEESVYRNLKALVLGGSTVSMQLRAKIARCLTPNLFVRWGTNETGTATMTKYGDVLKVKDSVGYPLPGFKIEIVDERGVALPAEVDGQIRVSSPTTINGYLSDLEATRKVFRDGWFYPGDIGHFAADGQLVHRGRADDMMIVSGVNVYPAEVEESLRSYPGVVDALATPLRHPQVQELPVALVVAESGHLLDRQAVLEHVRNQIGRHALHDLVFVDRIPRNEQGKVQREMVSEILRTQWGRCGAIADSKSRSAVPVGQTTIGQFKVVFNLPNDLRPGTLNAWLVLLDDQLLSCATRNSIQNDASEGETWLIEVLTLVLGLVHVLRIPLFTPIEILACHRPVAPAENWQGTCRLPDPTLVPAGVLEGVLKVAFKLAAWACKADSESQADREHFFQLIDKDVLKAFPKAKPQGKSTFEVLKVAHQLDIPSIALPGGIFQLGWGSHARRIDRSTTDRDSVMGMRWTRDKRLSAQLLRTAGLPGPMHTGAGSLAQARQAAERIGYPLVVKPADLERGEGVSVDVLAEGLEAAFDRAFKRSPAKTVLIEQQVPGVCHRLFIAAGKLLYAVRRLPMGVYADGRSAIRDLVASECGVQQRMPPWKRSGIRPLDDIALQMLKRQGWDPTSVPESGTFIALRRIETTAWGGVDEEVTATIHPDNVNAAIAASKLFGLDVAGVDMISQDIRQPWHRNGAIINEVNFAPLLGGAEISRSYVATYLEQLVKNKGRIPVEVFVGGPAALEVAKARQAELVSEGLRAWLSCGEQTLAPVVAMESANKPEDGHRIRSVAMPCRGLHARARALLLSRDVQALLLVVHDDELLYTGLPLDHVDVVRFVDADLVAAGTDKPNALSNSRANEMVESLRAWSHVNVLIIAK